MNFLHFFSRNKIDESVKEAREKTGSILLDVRTPEEYRLSLIHIFLLSTVSSLR